MSYYEKILCFTNICVFINKPENLDDNINVNKLQQQYCFNKRLLHPKIRDNFNESCLYIINHIDKLDKDTSEEYLKQKFISIIKDVDSSVNDLTVTCFSASYYIKYLSFEKLFKENKIENIEKIWEFFYEKYQGTFFKIFRRFSSIIMGSIEKYENYFKIKFEDNLLDIKCSYKEEIIKVYSKMEKLPRLDEEEQNEIASHLYNFYLKLNDNNYKFFNVRKEFITDINNKIKNANKLISRNYIFSLQNFFEELDPIFDEDNQELKKEDEKNIEEYINKVQKESIPKVENILEEKRNTIIKVFTNTEKIIKEMIGNEKSKVKDLVKKNEEEIKNNIMNFQQKVQFKIKEMENEVNKEFDNLGTEIKEYYDTSLNSLNKGLLKYKDSLNLLNKKITTTLFKAYLLIGINCLNFADTGFLIGCGFSMFTGGPIGIIIGIGIIGFSIGVGYLNYKAYSEISNDYLEEYNNFNSKIENNIFDSKEKVLKDFDDRKEIILKQIKINLQGIKLRLHASNDVKYEKKCKEFKRIKDDLRAQLQVH